jgi:hypothetical protein
MAFRFDDLPIRELGINPLRFVGYFFAPQSFGYAWCDD